MDEQRHEHPENARQKASDARLEASESDKNFSTAVGVLLVAAVFFFMMLAVAGPQQTETRVGQDVERNITPDTPRDPDNIIRR